MKSPAEGIFYDAEWMYVSGGDCSNRIKGGEDIIRGSVNRNKEEDVSIKIYTSEPMLNVAIRIPSLDNWTEDCESITEDSTEWETMLPAVYIKVAENCKNQILISGHDYAGNQIIADPKLACRIDETDNCNCSGEDAGTEDQNHNLYLKSEDEFEIEVVRVQDIQCAGDAEGKIFAKAVNAPSTNLKWSLIPGGLEGIEEGDLHIFSGLSAGNYTIIVQDESEHCRATSKAIVKEPPELIVTIEGATDFVGGPCSKWNVTEVILEAVAEGGTPYIDGSYKGYTWVWEDGPHLLNTNDPTVIVKEEGHYKVLVVDSLDCKSRDRVFLGRIRVDCSRDPNKISGEIGFDTLHWVSVHDTLSYMILFENDPKEANAPAQFVNITQPVDSSLNINSFRLGEFGFGSHHFTVPTNSLFYTDRLDLRDSLGIFVDVTAGINVHNHELFWRFESIDPQTGYAPSDAQVGFLPVNDSITQVGEGYVTYTISSETTTMTGDSAQAQAEIVFDVNEPIQTNTWRNRIDAFAPISSVHPLPFIVDTTSFVVSWSGKDDDGGVGVARYILYASQDGGPFQIIANGIDTTEFEFNGISGSTYAFFTRAVDYVGNVEAPKSGEVTVTISDTTSVSLAIPIRQGWNLISSYIKPDEPNILEVIDPIADEVIMMRDIEGNSAIPSSGINNIGSWNVMDGYQFKI